MAEVCRKHGISNATYYQWKSKHAGMSVGEFKRVKDPEAENSFLKRMYAELALHRVLPTDSPIAQIQLLFSSWVNRQYTHRVYGI